YHVGGLAIAVRCALASAEMILHERFDARACAMALRDGATHASLVATTLHRVLDAAAEPGEGVLGEARTPADGAAMPFAAPAASAGARPGAVVLVGGGPVPVELLARARL